jgi:hypothetical protein
MFNGTGWGAVRQDLSAAAQPYENQRPLGELICPKAHPCCCRRHAQQHANFAWMYVVPCASLILVIIPPFSQIRRTMTVHQTPQQLEQVRPCEALL